MMNSTAKAARLLLDARESGRKLVGLPLDCRPTCIADAYAIQQHVAIQLGGISGWKVNQQSAAPGLTCAPLPSLGVKSAAAETPNLFRTQSEVGVEVELGFVLRKDLPPGLAPYLLEEVIEAIDYACVAVEFVESRYQSIANVDYLSRLADFSSHSASVFQTYGTTSLTPGFHLELEAHLSLDTHPSYQAPYQRIAIPPLDLIMWLANQGTIHFGGLKQGQLIITGSCFPILYARAGTYVQASLSKIGSLNLRLK